MQNNGSNWGGAFGLFSSLAAALGISTQDLAYLIIAVLGLCISGVSFWLNRRDARRQRVEEAKRTAILEEYLDEVKNRPVSEQPTSVTQITAALHREKRRTWP